MRRSEARIAEAGTGTMPVPASAALRHRRRGALGLVVCGLLGWGLAACAPADASPAPAVTATTEAARVVTQAEAELLAGVGFQLGREATVAIAGTIVDDRGAVTLNGWLAPETHRAYAAVTTADGAAFLSLWSPTEVAGQDVSTPAPPLPIPAEGWESTALDASSSTLAAGQKLLVSVASDRPDNAQLVLQGRAMRLRADTVDGADVTVFSGPVATGSTQSNVHYWIASDGTLKRLEMRLDGVNWSTVDFRAETRDIFAGLGG